MTEIFNYCEIAMYDLNYKKKNQKQKNKKLLWFINLAVKSYFMVKAI